MSKRENCEHRHTNGNCLFNGGFCLANDEEHCVRINEIKSYNQALEDFKKALEKHQQENRTDNLEYGITSDDVEEVIKQLKTIRFLKEKNMSEYVKIKRRLYDELVETKAKYEVIKQLLETVNKVYEEQLKTKDGGKE